MDDKTDVPGDEIKKEDFLLTLTPKVEVDNCQVKITETLDFFYNNEILHFASGEKKKVSKTLKDILITRGAAIAL